MSYGLKQHYKSAHNWNLTCLQIFPKTKSKSSKNELKSGLEYYKSG